MSPTLLRKSLWLVLPMLTLLSCKKEEHTLGIDQPYNPSIGTVYVDTFTVQSASVLLKDSLRSSKLFESGTTQSVMVGAYSDPVFGNISAQAFVQFGLVTENISTAGATIDSAFLYLNYSYAHGDTNQNQTLNIHELTSTMSDVQYYTSSTAPAYAGGTVGSITFQARPNSVKTLKVALSTTYAQAILNAPNTNASFPSSIPGLAIVPGNNTDGAVLRVLLDSTKNLINIYYKGGSVPYVYELKSRTTYPKYFTVDADRSSTPLLNSLVNQHDVLSSTAASNQCFVQAGTGVRTLITIPYLSKLKEKGAIINKADLILTMVPSSGFGNYSPTTPLYLSESNGSGQLKYNSSNIETAIQKDGFNPLGTTNTLLLSYNTTSNTYTFPIKSYIQSILDSDRDNNGFFVSPYLYGSNVDRLVFGDASHPSAALKLKVYYTYKK